MTATFLTKKLLEIAEQCKGVHCVDLGESFPTSIYLQNLASIQPRTSRLQLGGIRCLRIVAGIMFAITDLAHIAS